MRQTLIDRIKKHEGLSLKPYHCSCGKLSIGYGRNLDDVGISDVEAEAMLIHDIQAARKECFLNFPNIFPDLNETRQDVLIEMAFNLGINRLKQFKKMFIALSMKNYEIAADEMLNSLWASQVGERAVTLANLMRKGELS